MLYSCKLSTQEPKKLGLNVSKGVAELRWLGNRLVGSYSLLLLVLFCLLVLNHKLKAVLLVVYVFGVLVLVAFFKRYFG